MGVLRMQCRRLGFLNHGLFQQSREKHCVIGEKNEKMWKVAEYETKWGDASFKKVWLAEDVAGFKTAQKSSSTKCQGEWYSAFENVLFVLCYCFNNFEELQHSINCKSTEFGEKR